MLLGGLLVADAGEGDRIAMDMALPLTLLACGHHAGAGEGDCILAAGRGEGTAIVFDAACCHHAGGVCGHACRAGALGVCMVGQTYLVPISA